MFFFSKLVIKPPMIEWVVSMTTRPFPRPGLPALPSRILFHCAGSLPLWNLKEPQFCIVLERPFA